MENIIENPHRMLRPKGEKCSGIGAKLWDASGVVAGAKGGVGILYKGMDHQATMIRVGMKPPPRSQGSSKPAFLQAGKYPGAFRRFHGAVGVCGSSRGAFQKVMDQNIKMMVTMIAA